MSTIRFIFYGLVFGLILIKVEAISWYRIQEMFHFQSFHMYGVLLSGIFVAFIGTTLLKKTLKINIDKKPLEWKANVLGGLSFGLGWAITGACTGPLYTLLGLNTAPAIVMLLGAILGTYLYAFTQKYLPHA